MSERTERIAKLRQGLESITVALAECAVRHTPQERWRWFIRARGIPLAVKLQAARWR